MCKACLEVLMPVDPDYPVADSLVIETEVTPISFTDTSTVSLVDSVSVSTTAPPTPPPTPPSPAPSYNWLIILIIIIILILLYGSSKE